jgi:diguanylate cyclase (GGDEF)-like protein
MQRKSHGIDRERQVGDLTITAAMGALLFFMGSVYLLTPSPHDAPQGALDPVWPALFILACVTSARLLLALRGPLPAWASHAAIWIEFATLYALIACFQARYEQAPAFVLKSPTFVWAFVFVGLRALRFDPREVLAAGAAAALGWVALVGWVYHSSGPDVVTRDFVDYMTAPTLLIGAEVEKVLALLAFSAALAFAMTRGARFLTRQLEAAGGLAAAFDRERVLNQELTRASRALSLALHRDALTGLASRKAFVSRAQRWSKNHKHVSYAIAVLDLNRFGVFNDTFGRDAGDAVLRAVATRLSERFAQSCLIARLGADAFALITPVNAKQGGVLLIARAAAAALAAPLNANGRQFVAGARVGVAAGDPGADPESVLADAELALHNGKGAPGRIAFFDPAQRRAAARRATLEIDLRSAAAKGELFLAYQPIVRLRDGALNGWEALMRWRHPERGLIGPDIFIPLAEETGAIIDLGAWALDQAARDTAAFVAAGYSDEAFVSVNVSPAQLSAPRRLLAAVEKAISLHPHVKLEITESTIIANPERAQTILRALKRMGASLSLDDFGTGASSLGQLRRFPFDTLKIDRAVILDAHTADATLLQAIVSMARSLNLATVAEGIETEADAVALRGLGAIYGQGYWHGRPATAQEILSSSPGRQVRQLGA